MEENYSNRLWNLSNALLILADQLDNKKSVNLVKKKELYDQIINYLQIVQKIDQMYEVNLSRQIKSTIRICQAFLNKAKVIFYEYAERGKRVKLIE